jgi:hypothetical protein
MDRAVFCMEAWGIYFNPPVGVCAPVDESECFIRRGKPLECRADRPTQPVTCAPLFYSVIVRSNPLLYHAVVPAKCMPELWVEPNADGLTRPSDIRHHPSKTPNRRNTGPRLSRTWRTTAVAISFASFGSVTGLPSFCSVRPPRRSCSSSTAVSASTSAG